jgi:hypothetical protein
MGIPSTVCSDQKCISKYSNRPECRSCQETSVGREAVGRVDTRLLTRDPCSNPRRRGAHPHPKRKDDKWLGRRRPWGCVVDVFHGIENERILTKLDPTSKTSTVASLLCGTVVMTRNDSSYAQSNGWCITSSVLEVNVMPEATSCV